jgi:3-hydroxyisobutyrate dehydrogenase-like beta-hydroxyacid dehydrogenase
MRVAFLGLGRMGAPMAARVAAAGHELTVWNRTRRPAAVPPATEVAASAAEAVAGAEVIITMLADAGALAAVLDGPSGILAGAPERAVLVDMGTIGPEAARGAAARCDAAGVRFLDAPVSGSVAAARTGTLLAMIGGEAGSLASADPVLATMTARRLHLGPVGAGATMKLAINLMLAVTNEAVAELLALARQAGIAPPDAYEVLAASAVGSRYVDYKREAFLEPDGVPVAFSIDLMRKDMNLALRLAHELGVPTPAGRAAAEVLDQTAAAGLGADDLSAITRTLTG